MTRKPIIAGNWKMNKNVEEAQAFVEQVRKDLPDEKKVEAVIAAPSLLLDRMVSAVGIAA